MATNDDHRVTKDISTRKTPGHGHGSIHASATAAANEAAREAYQASLIAGYEQKMSDLQAEYDKDKQIYEQKIRDMQVEQDAERKHVEDRIRMAVQATSHDDASAHATALAEACAATEEMQARFEESFLANKEAARASREQQSNHANRISELEAKHKTEIENMGARYSEFRASHSNEIRALRRQVKLEIRFASKTLKTRTFFRPPRTKFGDLVEDLLVEMRKHKPLLRRDEIVLWRDNFRDLDNDSTLYKVRLSCGVSCFTQVKH